MKAKKIWCRHGNFSNLEQRKSSKFQTQHSDFHWWHMAKLTNAWGFCHSFYPHFATNKKSYFFTCFRLAYETNSKQLTSSNPILIFRLDLLRLFFFFPFSHWLWNLLQDYFTETFSLEGFLEDSSFANSNPKTSGRRISSYCGWKKSTTFDGFSTLEF